MLKSPKFYKYLGFALFACSAVVTMEFMWSSALGIVALVIASIQGTAIESCKSGFTYIAISIESVGWKIFFGTLALIAFVFSVIFTFGYSTNMNNRVKNETMYSSEDYSKKLDDIQRQKDLYNQTKQALEDLKGQRDNQLQGMEEAKNQLPKNFKSQRVIEQDKINTATSNYQAKIEAKQVELDKLNDQLKEIKTEELPEDGYITMYQLFAKAINTVGAKTKGKVEKKPWSAEDVEFWFQITISLFLEFAGMGCLIYSQHLNAYEKPMIAKRPVINNDISDQIGFKAEPIVATSVQHSYTNDLPRAAYNSTGFTQQNSYNSLPSMYFSKTKNKIGFQAPASPSASASGTLNQNSDQTKSLESLVSPNVEGINQDISHSFNREEPKPCATHNVYEIDNVVLGYYLDYVFDNVKPDKSIPGYQTTTKELNQKHSLGLGIDQVRKLKNHCEELNILKSDSVSRKTYILKQRHEIKV
jgi:hypothetical protein